MTKQMFNGVLAQVGIFPIKDSIKNMTVKKPGPEFGKQYHLEKTHTIAVKVVGLEANGAPYDRWITLGHKKFQEGRELIYQVKQDDQWIDVFEGSTVFFFYEVKGEYVNIDIKTFRVMEQAPRPERVYTFGDAAPSGGSGSNSGGGGGGFKKGGDYLKGVKVGHAVNCATDHFKANSWRFDPEGMFDVGCFCNELTTEVEKITGDGAAAGCAVKAAAGLATNKDEIRIIAHKLVTLSDRFRDHIDGKAPQQQAPTPQQPDIPAGGDMTPPGDDLPF